jgi:hypothetical protein
LRFQPEFGQIANRGEVFTVIRQMPEADGVFQYQIKSKMDGHARVVPERQIADLNGRSSKTVGRF